MRTDEIDDEAAVGPPPRGAVEESYSVWRRGRAWWSVGGSELDCVAGVGERIAEADDGFEARGRSLIAC